MARLAEKRADAMLQQERIEGEARELIALAASLEEETRTRAAALEAAEQARAERQQEAEAATRRRAEASEARATNLARLEVLERLELSKEGVDAGARRIMEHIAASDVQPDGSRQGVFGLLSDLIRPEGDGAGRLDRMLGHSAGALVVRTRSDAMRWIEWLRADGQGDRARFLCLDMVRGAGDQVLAERGFRPGSLGCAPAIEALVGSVIAGTVLVPDLPAGIQEYLERGINAVTPTGERVTASGALLAGHDAQSLGLLERGAEVRSLRAENESLDGVLESATRDARAAEEAVRIADEDIRRLRRELTHHAEDKSRRGAALARVEKERVHVTDGLELLASETAELEAFVASMTAGAEEVATRLTSLEQERDTFEEQAEEWARGYLAVDADRKTASERRMELRIELADARARSEAARERVARAHEEIQRLEERATALDQEVQELGERRSKAEVEVTEAQALARNQETVRGEAGQALLTARTALEELESKMGAVGTRRREISVAHEKLRAELEQFRLKEGEYRVRIEGLIEQVRQQHDLDLEQVAAESEATEDIDLDAMDVEVEELRRKLDSLGNVNLNAIVELEEAQQHVEFLQAQEKDLLDAKADLEKAIKELDDLSTARFGEVFEKIRVNFRETFRRLFGGGRAEIILEDASNLLESGIEIIARPPGKEQRTISLLSGGERTLTAVALLFAVFQAKPSPFSVLDEVDAALDEANVRRLVGLIQDFTDRTQFLIVTHAKSTMEMADVLYGVTMEEPGVSKRVAVRLTEFPEEAQAAAV